MKWLIVFVLLLQGCSTIAEKYTFTKEINGQEIEVEVIKITGTGRGKYADGSEIEGKPAIELPDYLPPIDFSYEEE